MIFVIGSLLFGALLGRFFKVLILVPVCGLVIAMVIAWSWYAGNGVLHTLGAIAVLVTSIQVGFASGMLSTFFPDILQHSQKQRIHRASQNSTLRRYRHTARFPDAELSDTCQPDSEH
jgi:hypothetical protein